MEPYYQYLIDNSDIKILVFSGDDDSVCGTIGTQSWIYDLDYDITSRWTSWDYEGQVAGYVEKFDGFTFATVHGEFGRGAVRLGHAPLTPPPAHRCRP